MNSDIDRFVTVIGGANVDIFGRSFEALQEQDSNPGQVHTSPGGVARNIAENLARLHVRCHLVTAVGNDQNGEMLLAQGSTVGIDMQGVQRIEELSTSTCMSVLDSNGDMRVAIADMGIMDRLDANRLASQKDVIERSSLIILDANLPDDALAWLTNKFPEHTIFADTVSAAKAARLKPYLGSIHTLKTGAIEAQALTGLDAQTDGDVQKLAEWIHSHGVRRLFLTRGDHGVFYSTDRTRAVMAPQQNIPEVANTSGAGDAFLAGIAYSWLAQWSVEESVDFALAAAQITVQSHATCSPTLSLAAIANRLEPGYAV
ncbi:MAG: carbohydrate kinase family protein [Woeseiaceae bacterium]